MMDIDKDYNLLVTGASGMLGRYVKESFANSSAPPAITSLGRDAGNDIVCDLRSGVPDLGGAGYDLVVHCAGTEEKADAMALNHTGTGNLLKALESNPPRHFVYISSYRVYGSEGSGINESAALSDEDEVASSKILAEKMVENWAQTHDVKLTVIRPARMFGSGVGGETLRIFNDALNGSYIHIRGNNARVSLVTALDVAEAITRVYREGGTYNAADGADPRLIDMVEAMTANAGQQKRMTHLPAAWAEWLWRLFRWVPAIDRNLNPSVASERMKTFTIDGSLLAEKSGIKYHDTITVISRKDPTYPYSEK